MAISSPQHGGQLKKPSRLLCLGGRPGCGIGIRGLGLYHGQKQVCCIVFKNNKVNMFITEIAHTFYKPEKVYMHMHTVILKLMLVSNRTLYGQITNWVSIPGNMSVSQVSMLYMQVL